MQTNNLKFSQIKFFLTLCCVAVLHNYLQNIKHHWFVCGLVLQSANGSIDVQCACISVVLIIVAIIAIIIIVAVAALQGALPVSCFIVTSTIAATKQCRSKKRSNTTQQNTLVTNSPFMNVTTDMHCRIDTIDSFQQLIATSINSYSIKN